jgi:hypothetical protein
VTEQALRDARAVVERREHGRRAARDPLRIGLGLVRPRQHGRLPRLAAREPAIGAADLGVEHDEVARGRAFGKAVFPGYVDARVVGELRRKAARGSDPEQGLDGHRSSPVSEEAGASVVPL